MEEARDKKGLTEKEFLEIYRTKNYPRPFLTADMVIFRKEKQQLKVLLVKRGGHPFIGKWALPGGFAKSDETIEETSIRELSEETGVQNVKPVEVGIFSKPGRDPRGWVVTMAYCALLEEDQPVKAGDDAKEADWFTIKKTASGILLKSTGMTLSADELAFDHKDILEAALSKIQAC